MRVPLDIEQLAELATLRTLLRRAKSNSPTAAPHPKQLKALAILQFVRLPVVLMYLARSTNWTGLLEWKGQSAGVQSGKYHLSVGSFREQKPGNVRTIASNHAAICYEPPLTSLVARLNYPCNDFDRGVAVRASDVPTPVATPQGDIVPIVATRHEFNWPKIQQELLDSHDECKISGMKIFKTPWVWVSRRAWSSRQSAGRRGWYERDDWSLRNGLNPKLKFICHAGLCVKINWN